MRPSILGLNLREAFSNTLKYFFFVDGGPYFLIIYTLSNTLNMHLKLIRVSAFSGEGHDR